MAVYALSPQVHWMVFVARGCPEAPDNYTGIWRTWLSDGTMVTEAQYSNGKLDGPSIHWDTTEGGKRAEEVYRDGNLNGPWKGFYKNGSVRKSLGYADGKPIGHCIVFYEDGRTNYESSYSRPGVHDGEEVQWSATGEKKVLRVWRDGQPWNGYFWSRRGEDAIRITYESGRRISETNMGPLRIPRARGRPVINQNSAR
jgi:antitoxin component YwqK of YwqJK toxin-antitoxin module